MFEVLGVEKVIFVGYLVGGVIVLIIVVDYFECLVGVMIVGIGIVMDLV